MPVPDFSTISGLQSWHSGRLGTFTDNALTTAAVNDGDPIGGWIDKQANANATQATTANKPSRGLLARPAGLAGVKFNYAAPSVLGLGIPSAYANLSNGSFSIYGLLNFYNSSGTYSTIFAKTSASFGPHGRIWFGLDNSFPQLFGNTLNADLILSPPSNAYGFVGTAGGTSNQYCNPPFAFGYSFQQTSGSTGIRTWWINGAQYTSGTITLAAANTSDNFTFGQQNDSNYPWNGEIKEWAVWNTALTNAQFAACDAYVKSIYGSPQITCLGDSITAGNVVGGGLEYPTMLAQLLGGSAIIVNNGFGGATLTNMLANVPPYITSAWTIPATQKIVFLWGGTNDLNTGLSPAQAYANLRSLCGAIKANNPTAKIVLIGCIPRSVNPAGTVQAFNSLLRPSFTAATNIPLVSYPNAGVSWADLFIDIFNIPEIAGVDTSATYFLSGTHPTAYLNQIIVQRYFAPAAKLIMSPKTTIRRAA